MFVYKIQVDLNPIHAILKYGDYYDFIWLLWLWKLNRSNSGHELDLDLFPKFF